MPEMDVLYRVAAGDTLVKIAEKFGIKSVQTLVEYNNAHPKKTVTLAEGANPPEASLLYVPLATGMRHEVVVGAKKIPLGGKATGAKTVGMFKVYVPEKRGGKLTLTHADAGSVLQVFHPDTTTHAADAAGNPVPAAAEITFDVPKGKFGWFYVLHVGTATPEVSAKFVQKGLARDGTDDAAPPLVPYNFWYWSLSAYANPPVAHKDKPPYQPFSKLDKKFGLKSLAWEQDAVNGHCYIDPNDPEVEKKKKDYVERTGQSPRMDDPTGALSWTGHCHNSAPASIIFSEPKAFEDFNVEELEHLGAECYGNHGNYEAVWVLRAWDRSIPEHTTKPSEKPDLFGELAATFHQKLVEWVGEKKHALMMDMRDAAGKVHAQVWNQAMFMYEAEIKEHPEASGSEEEAACDTLVEVTTWANRDYFWGERGSFGSPADIAGNDATANDLALAENIKYRLVWKGGDVQAADKKNRWESAQREGTEMYAPRWLIMIKPLGRSVRYNANGNPDATRERLETLGVKPRARYY